MGAASFRVPIYSGRVVICTTKEAYQKVHADLEGEPYGEIDGTRGLSSRHSDKKKCSVYLIGVFDGDEGTLVHELVHTTFEMLTHAGIPISKRNDETFAYLMDALYKESITAMRKAKK